MGLRDKLISAMSIQGKFKELALGDFKEVRDTVQALWDKAGSVNKIKIKGKYENLQDVKNQFVTHNQDLPKSNLYDTTRKALSDFQKFQIGFLQLKASLRMASSWAEVMDANDPERPYQTKLIQPIRDASNDYRIESDKYYHKLLDALDPIKDTLDNKSIKSKDLKYEFGGMNEVMGALLHTGNDSNLQKLLRGNRDIDGNPWGDFFKDENGKIQTDETGKRLLNTSRWDAFIKELEHSGKLTKAHYKAVKGIWDIMEELRPRLQDSHKEMNGFNFPEILPRTLHTLYGDVKGGYFPAKVDPWKNEDAHNREAKAEIEAQYDNTIFPTVGKGSTLARNEFYAEPLKMDISLAMHHVDWALRYIHLQPRVQEISRLVFNKDFRASLGQTDPIAARSILLPWLRTAARQRTEESTDYPFLDNAFHLLRRNVGQAYLTANIADVLSRTMSLSLASLKVSPTHMANAFVEYTHHPFELAEANRAESKFMATRPGVISGLETQQLINNIIFNKNFYNKSNDFLDKHAYCLQMMIHHMMDHVVYHGAKEEALTPKEEGGLGYSMQDAIRHAEDTVIKTQGSFNPEEVSPVMTGTPFKKMMIMFYGFFNTQYNLAETEFVKASRGYGIERGVKGIEYKEQPQIGPPAPLGAKQYALNKLVDGAGLSRRVARLFLVYMMGGAATAILWKTYHNEVGGRGLIGKTPDETMPKAYLDWLFGSQLRNAAGVIPWTSQAQEFISHQMTHGKFGSDMQISPAFDALETAMKTPFEINHALHHEGSARIATRDFMNTLATFGVRPATWLARPTSYLAGLRSHEYRSRGALDFARGLVSGTPQK